MALMKFSRSVISGKKHVDIDVPSGCVNNIPLAGNITPEVGNTPIQNNGSFKFEKFDSLDVAKIEYSEEMWSIPYLTVEQSSPITGTASRSVCFWAYPTNNQTYCNAVGMGATSSHGMMFNCGCRTDGEKIYAEFTTWGNDVDVEACANDGKLHFFAYCYDTADPTVLNIYFDGKLLLKQSVDGIDTESSPIYIGRSGAGDWEYQGYLAGVKVFNRCLSANEVTTLYSEYPDGVIGYNKSNGFDGNGIPIKYHSTWDAGTSSFADIITDDKIQITFDKASILDHPTRPLSLHDGASLYDGASRFGKGSLYIASGYADIFTPDASNPNTCYWTVEAWFFITGNVGFYAPIMNMDDDRSYNWAWCMTLNGDVKFQIRAGTIYSLDGVDATKWHHIRVTRGANGFMSAHFDGVRLYAGTEYGDQSFTQCVRFGQYVYGSAGSQQFYGYIDNFIFQKLTEEEVALYSGETAPVTGL